MQQTNPTILIIGGNGRMGQWFQNIFINHSLSVTSLGRKDSKQLKSSVSNADIVIISVPISQTLSVIEQIIPFLKENSLLTDLTSLKELPMQAMRKAPCGTLGMHPLFGPSIVSGRGQKIVFCEQKNNAHVTFLKNIFIKEGMEVITMTPQEHDRQMATLQALTHMVNILVAQTMEKSNVAIDPRLTTPLFTLQNLTLTRVLAQDPELIADIQLLNPHFKTVLKAFAKSTEDWKTMVMEQKRATLEKKLIALHNGQTSTSAYSLTQTNKILQMLSNKPSISRNEKVDKILKGSVAFLGPEGTYTHQAARSLSKISTHLHAKTTIRETLGAVLNKQSDFAIVPVENSIHGTVRETLDTLSDMPLTIVGSYDMPIHHNLLSLEKDVKRVQTIISHPQALAQCAQWLDTHIPKALRVFSESTTAPLKDPKQGFGYIASIQAAEMHSIPVLATSIEDDQTNTTKFIVVARNTTEIPHLSNNNTLLYLTIHNRVGILRDILEIFAKRSISLNKLESRPSIEKMWDYSFYIEVNCKSDQQSLIDALQELQAHCSTIRVLGRT